MMKYYLSLVVIFIMAPVQAQEQRCVKQRDESLAALGHNLELSLSSVRKIGQKSKDCLIESNNYVDCEYSGKNGLKYLVEGNEVIRVEAYPSKNGVSLPFGLSYSDKQNVAIQKIIGSLSAAKSIQIRKMENGDISVGLTECFRSPAGSEYETYFSFDRKGNFIKIGLRENW